MSEKPQSRDPKATNPSPKVQLDPSKVNKKHKDSKSDNVKKRHKSRKMLPTAEEKRPKQQTKEEPKKPKHEVFDDDEQEGSQEVVSVDLLRDADMLWHELLEQLPTLSKTSESGESYVPTDLKFILEKKKAALALYEDMTARFQKKLESNRKSDEQWMKMMLQSGTSSDKMAAMTLMLQNGSLFRKQILEQLVGLAAKKNRRERIMAIDTLREIFVNDFIPSNRKLVPFHKRPLLHPNVTNEHLIIWFFEDFLKEIYHDYVKIIDELSHDTIIHSKKKAQQVAFDLLCEKPEQEQFLLQLLVNKLGDPENKIASNSVYILLLLLDKHPNMKPAVVREVEGFLHRPNVTDRAKYYSVILLNQIVLSRHHVELSQTLLKIYFDMFTKLIESSKEALDSRMLSALLTGVNRAFPFAPQNYPQFEEHMNTLYKLAHVASFNKSVQALLLIFQYSSAQKNVPNRFYRVLYEKLLSPDLASSSKQGHFLNLLYKAIKADENNPRVAAFLKRLLQVALYQKPGFACGALYLTSEIFKLRPKLRSAMIDQGESVGTEDLMLSQRIIEQIESQNPKPAEDNHGIKVVTVTSISKNKKKGGQVEKKEMIVFDGKPRQSRPDYDEIATKQKEEDDIIIPMHLPVDVKQEEEEEEDYAEGNNEQEPEEPEEVEEDPYQAKRREQIAALLASDGPIDLKQASVTPYDPSKRDPEYAGADFTALWELNMLAMHYHPSVAHWANLLLIGQTVQYTGDPLKDMSLYNFLDKFMYKNPKSANKLREAAPASVERTMKSRYTPRSIPVNSEQFLSKSENQIPEHELFFYKYFKEKKRREPEHKKQTEDEEEAEDAAIDSFEADVDEAEIETALLEALEKKENKQILERDEENKEYDYDDMAASDVEESDDSIDDQLFAAAFNDDNADDEDASLDEEDDFPLNEEDELSGEEEQAEESKDGKGSKKKKKESKFKGTFASLDEFAHLLETSGFDEENAKQIAWEQQRLRRVHGLKRKRPEKKEKKGSGKRNGPPAKRRKR